MQLARSTLFFDLGNVLIFYDLKKMCTQISECTKISSEEIQGIFINTKFLAQYEKGQLTSQELHRLVQSKTAHQFSLEEMLKAMADIFTPNLEIWPIVEDLKKRNYRLVLISNTNECHFQYAFSHFPILQLFDKLILSYQVGASKPDRRIFEKALLEARGKTFYTDDNPSFVEAGRLAGLDAEVFTGVQELRGHLSARGII